MLSTATTWFRADPAYVLLPAGLLFLTVLAFTVLGDALRVALGPREVSRLGVGRWRTRTAGTPGKSGGFGKVSGPGVAGKAGGSAVAGAAGTSETSGSAQKGGPA